MERISKPIKAAVEEQQEFLVMFRSYKIKKQYSQCASVILLSLQGKSLEEIIQERGLSRPVVNEWRPRRNCQCTVSLNIDLQNLEFVKVTKVLSLPEIYIIAQP